MLYAVFIKLEHNSIKKFERIPFNNAVALTDKLEKECRESKKIIVGEFQLYESENDIIPIYEGIIEFGSYYAPNLFIHIKKKLPNIPDSKDAPITRLDLLAKMEDQTDEKFKIEEIIENEELMNLDRSKISKLKKWQRRTIYSASVIFLLLSIGLFTFFFMQIASFNKEYKALEKSEEKNNALVETYELALLGDKEQLNKFLSKEKKLSRNENLIFTSLLIDKGNFKEALEINSGDASFVADFISKNKPIEKLKEFDKEHPTNEAKFDLAFAEKDFNTALGMTDVKMNTDRSKKRTYALLKVGNSEEALTELQNNNDKEMEKRVKKYISIQENIKKLDQEIENADDNEKTELEAEKEEMKNQLNNF